MLNKQHKIEAACWEIEQLTQCLAELVVGEEQEEDLVESPA